MAKRITEIPVHENNYEEEMRAKVEPYLASLRTSDTFPGFDGNPIHYETYLREGARANIVIVHGFTESAEKFREMAYNFLQMDYNVFVIDNRGHGQSYRRNPDDPETVTVRVFEDYVRDLYSFVVRVVTPHRGGLPLYLYAHSMGGAIAVQFLQTYPGVFDKAVLSAPMIEPRAPMPPALALLLMRFFVLLGKGDRQVFIYHGFEPDRTYEQSHDTSKARFDYYHQKRKENRLLQTSSASYRWVREAVKVSKKNLDPERCKRITIPVLLCQPEEDSSVVSEQEDAFIARIPNGRLARFTNCRHEIYASVDATVLEYLQTIEAFLSGEDD